MTLRSCLIAVAALAATFMLLLFPQESRAAMMFGTDEEVHKLQDVDITGQNNEALYLGYKTSTTWFVGGVSIKDDGYVFGVRDDSSKFIETTPEEIAKFQASGLLPNPLPPYKISTIDYILGYSLWIIILPILVIYFLFVIFRKKKAPPPAASTP